MKVQIKTKTGLQDVFVEDGADVEDVYKAANIPLYRSDIVLVHHQTEVDLNEEVCDDNILKII